MTTSESINELAAALAKAQAQITGASRTAANPFFKSRYADLASVWDAVRGPLTAHGLAVVQAPSTEGARVTVTTRLIHSSGQWIEASLAATCKDESPQAIGSAVTYLRRYGLQAVAGVPSVDDDGEAAQPPRGPVAVETAPTTPAGYDDFLAHLEATADDGVKALKAAWTAAPQALRAHVTAHDARTWADIKQRAEAADVGRETAVAHA